MHSLLPTTFVSALILTATASAHVELTSPNGGEVLKGQSNFTIEWYDIVSHGGSVTYDLEFSTDQGQSWLPIASDLPYTDGISTFSWQVPDIDTNQGRIRVTMKLNSNDHWDDISDTNFTINASYHHYGAGTAVNGITPLIRAQGIPSAGASIQISCSQCQVGADVHLIAGTAQLNLPRFGVTLLTNTDLAHVTATADANGEFMLPATLPANTVGLTVHLQAVVESTPNNSASDGLMFTVLP